ncbi:hypothetical protein E3N88_32364 [Mikania micrantha]|uniref:H(+)-transporting two-sector ATPase n=1 Tax=Mikania micrantha TaxID=192012 RepID=A0A5N6M878_9ASTR|nr:hypothetical protein E3N88_32364 [Mikania micrantha]
MIGFFTTLVASPRVFAENPADSSPFRLSLYCERPEWAILPSVPPYCVALSRICGPVLDVAFPPGKMPNTYNAQVVKGRDTIGLPINVTCEVRQLLGNNRVRAVAMSATDGLTRGMVVIDTGAPLSVPVGGATL